MMNEPEYNIDENGNKFWRLHGKLHRDDGAAVEWVDGDKEWWWHGKLHRDDAPAVKYTTGYKAWFLHGKRHREDGAAIELASGTKMWYLHDVKYQDANAWAQDVLKLHNKLHDDAAANNYLRDILMKDDLI